MLDPRRAAKATRVQLHVALDTLRMLLAAFLAMLGRGSISSSALDAGSTDDHTLRAQASRSNQMQAMGESVELRPPAGSAAAALILTWPTSRWPALPAQGSRPSPAADRSGSRRTRAPPGRDVGEGVSLHALVGDRGRGCGRAVRGGRGGGGVRQRAGAGPLSRRVSGAACAVRAGQVRAT